LLARPQGATNLVSADRLAALEPARAKLLAEDLSFADILRAENLVLAADLLAPFAHWITPIVFPKRYDTHFFVAVAPADQIGAHDGNESVDSLWIAPLHAIAEADQGRAQVEFATRRNLEKIGRSRTATEAITAARASKIVTVQPELTRAPDGHRMRLPPEADYGGEHFMLEG
jgi:hypothetical protein